MNLNNLAAIIDGLGTVKAQIAELEAKETELKKALEGLEPGPYEGTLFRVSISVADRDTLDMKAVREKLSAQFIRAHTTTKSVRTVRVTARTGGE